MKTAQEIKAMKEEILSKGGAPIVSVCSVCKSEYDVKPGGEPYPPHRRISHGYCSEGCTKKFLSGQ